MSQENPAPRPNRLWEIARYFITLGFTAFGGPAAHVAMMERDLVHRRAWLSRQHFLDLIAAINFIPGPNSTELAIALGRLRGGFLGMVLAGVCFIVPAMLIILPIAWLYVTFHELPRVAGAFRGISAAVVAIVAAAVIRLAASALKTRFAMVVGLGAGIAEIFSHLHHVALGDLLILATAAAIGAMRSAPQAKAKVRSIALPTLVILAMSGIVTLGRPAIMTLLFLKIGATLFGSGYVLVTYLQSTFVDQQHWLSQQQVLDSVAVGQVTPGPLLTTATFIGFVLGHDRFGGGLGMEIGCGLAATAAIFAPAFVLIAALGPSLERVRNNPSARGALDAMNAAVVGLIAATCLFLTDPVLHPPRIWLCAVLIVLSLALQLLSKINTTWIILGAAVLGGWLL
jgi:chromate transporter